METLHAFFSKRENHLTCNPEKYAQALVFTPHTSLIACWKEEKLLHTITESFFQKKICKKNYGLIFNKKHEKIVEKMRNFFFLQITNFRKNNSNKALCYCIVIVITFKMSYHLPLYVQ